MSSEGTGAVAACQLESIRSTSGLANLAGMRQLMLGQSGRLVIGFVASVERAFELLLGP